MTQTAPSAKAIVNPQFSADEKRNDYTNDLSANAGILPLKFQKKNALSPINSILKPNDMKIKFLLTPVFWAFSLVIAMLLQSEFSNALNMYRSRQSGPWSLGTTWDYSTNGGITWIASSIAPSPSDSTITVRSPHIVTISIGTTTTDQTVVDLGATLTLSSDTLTLNNDIGEDLVINGSMIWIGGGVVNGAGSMTISPGATCLLGNGASMGTGTIGVLSTTLTNSGTFTWSNTANTSSSIITFHTAGATINNNGIFNGNLSGSTNSRITTSGGTVTNNSGGVINGNCVGSNNMLYFSSVFTNNGTLNSNSETVYLNLGGASTNSGVFNAAASATLLFSGSGTHTYNGSSSFTGSGSINFANATHNLSGSFTNTNPTISGGTVNFNQSTVAFTSLVLLGPGTLSGSATKTISSSMVWMLGASVSGGAITINNGATCSLGNGMNYSSSDYVGHLSTSLTNNGTFSWSNSTDNSAVIVTFDMTGGTLNNSGVINCSLLGTFSAMAFSGGALNNSSGGIFNNNSPDNEISIGSTLTNNGTINANSATTSTNMSTLGGNINVATGAILNSGMSTFTGTNFSNNGVVNSNASFTNSGTYKGNGAFNTNLFTNAAAGHVAPGNSPGCQTFNNGFTSLGNLDIEINGTATACTDYDKITVTGTATITGSILNVTIGYTPVNNDQVTFIAATTLSGTFATLNAPAGWAVSYNSPSSGMVTLVYTAPCIPTNEYRSFASGNWSIAATWERFNGCTWVPASVAPSSSDSTITILNGHIVTSAAGPVTADQIVVQSGATLAINASTFTVNDGTGTDLDVNGTLALIGGHLAGAGSVSVNSGATFNWGSGSIMQGSGTTTTAAGSTTTITGGTVQLTAPRTLTNNSNNFTLSSASIFLNSSATFNNAGTVTLAGDYGLIQNTGPSSSVISNSGTISKTSGIFESDMGGTITTFTNTGTLTANAGIIRLLSGASTYSGTFNTATNGTFSFFQGTHSISGTASFIGTGSVIFTNSVIVTMDAGCSFAPTVAVTHSAATVNWNNSSTISSLNFTGGTMDGAGTVSIANSFTWTAGTMQGTGTTTILSSATTATKSGGTANLSGSRVFNNASSNFIFSAGAINFNNNAVFNNSGTINIADDISFGYAGGIGVAINNSGTITKTGGTGTAALGNASFLPFSNLVGGVVNVNSGTLQIGSGATQSGNYFISPGCGINATGLAITGTITNNGTLSNSTSFTNSGTYKGSGAYTGSLFTNAPAGHVAPGNSPGCQTYGAGFTSTGSLDIEVNGTAAACINYDKITVTGTATLGGALNVTVGYTPANNDQVTFIAATTLSGAFASLSAPAGWAVSYNSPSTGMVTLTYTAPCIPTNEYRSFASGDWSSAATWQIYNGCSWVVASTAPSSADSTITIQNTHTVTLNSSITADQVTVATGGTLFITGPGVLTLNNGIGTDLIINGTLDFNGSTLTQNSSSTISVNSGGTFLFNSGTFSGNGDLSIQNGGTLNFAGTGSIFLSGTKTITNSGTINWLTTTTDINYNGGNITLNNNANFNISANAGFTFGGSGSFIINNNSTGILTKSGSVITTLDDGITLNNNSGVIFITNGTLRLSASLYNNFGTINISSGASLTVLNANTYLNGGTSITGSGIINMNGGDNFIQAQIQIPSGTTVNFTSGTIQGANKLRFLNAATMNWAGGTLTGNANTELDNGAILNITTGNVGLRGNHYITNNGTINWNSTGNIVYDGGSTNSEILNNSIFNIGNSAGILNSGGGSNFFTLTNTATGTINKTNSTTTLDANVNLVNSGTINVTSGTLSLNMANVSTQSGTFNIAAAGTLSGSNSMTYTGSNFINNGNVSLSSNIINNGTYKGLGTYGGSVFFNNTTGVVAPGNSPGCQSFSNGFTSSGTLNIEVNGTTTACTDYDKITVTGTATIGGSTLNVTVGYSPANNDQVTFIAATALSGTFATVNAPANWAVNYNSPSAGMVTLVYTSPCIPTNDYRSFASGHWSSASTWETYNGCTWVPASGPPSSADNLITIRNGHILVAGGATIYADQLTIEAGATLNLNEAILELQDGPGTDLDCFGTLLLNTSEFNVAGDASFKSGSTFNWEFSAVRGPGIINLLAGCDFNLQGFGPNNFENGITLNNYAGFDIDAAGDFICDGATTTFNNYFVVNLNNSVHFIDNNANGHAFNNMPGGTVGTENTGTAEFDIEFNNSGIVDIVDGTITLNNTPTAHTGTYTLYSPGTLGGTASLSFAGDSITNNGNIVINQLQYSGTGSQSINGNGSIANLYINNPDGVDLLGDQTITTDVNLLGGRIITGSNKLITAENATISNASGFGFIEGNLERYISVPGNVEYPIGDLANTAFITLGPSFTGPGYVEARTDEGDHQGIAASGIDATKSLNRTWTITNNGLVFSECDVTFNWDGDEVDGAANPANFVLAKYDNPTWTLPSAVIPGANSLYVGNLTSFSEFQIGELLCVVTIPDTNFKNALLANASINTNSDGEIQCSEAADYTGGIDVNSLGITDLTGIEAFTGITLLNCYNNNLTSINLSANTALITLYCNDNDLTALDLTSNTALQTLGCTSNQLTSLNLSSNIALQSIEVGYNSITSLDLTALTNLTSASLQINQLSTIDLSNNINITYLAVNDNQLTSLDVSALTGLTQLYTQTNPLLTSLNIQNGNNANLTAFDATNCPLLSCIQVDNVTNMNTNWSTGKDAGATYSTNCAIHSTIVTNNFDSGPGSLRDIVTYAFNGDTITFDNTVGGYTIYLASEILLDKNLVIQNTLAAAISVSGDNVTRIFNIPASTNVTIKNLILRDGRAATDGGGILNAGTLTIDHCTMVGNHAAVGGNGGAILNSLTLNIYTSTISGNDAYRGGGIYNSSSVNVYTSTISANTASFQGGGIYTSAIVTFGSTILAGNSAGTSGPDGYKNGGGSTNYSAGYNLVGDNTSFPFVAGIGDLVGTAATPINPLLSSPVNNGGVTLTMALQAGSPAIDAGDPTNNSYDQAGFAVVGGIRDIGAFEYQTPPCVVNIPDSSFKAALLGNASINTNSDGEIQCSEAAAYNGSLTVSNLGIADLTGIEAFTSLIGLTCNGNSLTSLDVSSNTQLIVLYCHQNAITSLDVSGNTSLQTVYCLLNALTSLNVTGCTNLDLLNCSGNQLTSIDLSTNLQLTSLALNSNQISSLDLTGITGLTYFSCDGNALTSLNMQNVISSNLSYFSAVANPSLTCILVDDPANMNANWSAGKDASASFSSICPLPPAAALDFDGVDDKVVVTNSNVDLSNNSFSVEMWLKQSGNSDYDIAFSQGGVGLPNQTLHIGFKPGGSTFLFNFDYNDLEAPVTPDFNWHHWACTFDNVTKARKVYRDGFLIASDISPSTFIGSANTDLYIGDVAYGTNNFDGNIDELRIWTAARSQLQIQADMNCEIVPQPGLAAAYHFNQGLAFSNNSSETTLTDNSGNGHNGTLNNFALNGTTSNWVALGGVVSGTVCTCVVNIPDANFKNALLANAAINTNSDGEIQCSEAAAYSGTINVFSSSISDLTGIETFTSLTILNCAGNQLTTLDVSANVALTSLVCSDNQLSTLDVTANSALQYLSCDANQILNIDVSGNTGLIGLWCYNNQLSSLTVSANTALQILDCGNNQFTTLDLSGNFALVELYCSNTLLSSLNIQNGNNTFLSNFDATGNPALTCIQVDDPSYMNANWSAGKDPGASFSTNCAICIEADVPLATASSTQVCVGNTSTTLQINSGNLNNAAAWHWYTGSCGGTPIGTGTSILVAPTDTTTYYVRGEGGCTTPGACGQITINVNPIPVPVISADSRLCIENGSVTLSVTDSVTNNLLTYSWSTGETTSTIVITAAGTYDVSVVSNGGCNAAAAPFAITMDTCFIPVVTTSGSGTSGTGVGGDVIDVGNNPNTEDTTVYQIFGGYAVYDITVVEGQRENVLALLLSPAYGLTDTIDNGDNELIITGTYPNAHLNLLLALIPASLVRAVDLYLVPATNSVSQGITFSKGDIAMHSDSARKSFGLEGEGVKIGVLSNSYNMQPGNPAQTDVLNGDLPGVGNAYNTNPVEVLQEYPYRRQSDEGRAMLQIVHDIAPKAKLAFKTGILTAGHMADGIMELMQDTCNIIVDDISYIEEPFFQDGLVAQAVDNVTSQGVTYFTSSGNFGSSSYENTFSGVAAPPGYTGEAHNFANGFNGTPDIYQSVSFAPGIYTIALQWNEDFYSLGQNSGAISDLDIYLVDNSGHFLFGYNKNNIGGDPSEVLSFNVRGNAQANIMIVKRSGTANVRFKYVVFRGSMTINEYSIGESTVVGQANAAGAIAVGAVLYTNTPAFGENTPTVASFSSRGGTAINGVVRHKPDFVAPNGVNTTVNMGSANIDGDQFPNFFGTSCAAPHAAGVAALLVEGKRKFYNESLNSSGVKALLDSTAIDMYTPGYDINSGYGFIQADAALRTFASPEPIIKQLIYDSVNITPGTQIFNLTVVGSFFSPQSEIVLRGIHLATSYNALTSNLTASIPTFTGNPAIQAYNPPISPSGFDGGYSDPVFFAPSLHHTVTVIPDNKTKHFGEKLPVFTASTILIDNIPIANTGYTLADIGLDDMEFTSSATSTSNTGIYYIRAAHNLDPQDPDDAVILDTYVYTFEDGLLTIEKLPLVIKPLDKTITYGDKIDGTEIEFTYQYDDSNILPGEQAALLNYLKGGYEPFVIKEVVMIDDRDEYNGALLSATDLNNLSLMSGAQGRINGAQGRINGAQARVNTVGEPDTTFTIDLPFESLYNYNLHGNEADLTDSVMLQNGAQGRVNGARGIINAESLINGNEIINGAQGRINGAQGRVNGAQGRVNGAQGRVNGDELDGSSNSNTATVVHESDLDFEIGNADYEFLLYPTNGITGLTVGSHWIIPAAFLDANLLVTYAPASLVVQPIEIKVKAENKSVVYGTAPAYTSEITGYQFDDSLANVFSGNINYSPASNSQINVGSHSIVPVPTLAQPSNYYLTITNGNIGVTPATLTITADNQNPLCSSLPVFTSTITGYKFSDDAGNVIATMPGYTVLNNLQQPVSGIPPLGTYQIVPGGAQLITPSNYVLQYVNGTLVEPALLTLTATPTQPQCFGQTGSVVRTGSGGTAPYTYNATATTGLGTGTYNYTVTDANGCTASASVTITVPSAIVANTSVTNSSCSANTGTATVTANGGSPGYTYLWSNGQTTQSISGLANGTYTVTVKDSYNCTTTATATVIHSGSAPAIPGTISGPVGVCRNQTGVVFTVAAVSGATSYTWTLPTGATGSSTTNSITLAFGGSYSTGNLSVKANNFCGSSANSTKSVPRLTAAPATPGTITGSASLCALTTQTYSIGSVTNATSYTWTVSAGLTIATGQNTATVTVSAAAGFASGTVSVKANNCIGSSSNSIKNVYGAITAAPVWQNGGNDNFTTEICGGSSHDYEIAANNAAATRTWGAPSGCVISDKMGHTGNPLTVTGTDPAGEYEVTVTFPAGFVSGNITVYATNGCGNSPTASLAVQSKPNAPGAISGPTTNLCQKDNQVYSIAAVNGATTYTWTVPSGVTIKNNYGTSINVKFNSAFIGSGSITVKANNACGSSAVTSLSVSALTVQPGSITGNASVCKSNTSVPYSIAAVTGATSYTWAITGGATFVGAATGASVNVRFTGATATSATLTARANNACGSSTASTKTITVNLSCRDIEDESTAISSISEIIVYPNPASDKLNISFNAIGNEKYSIRLIDIIGNILLSETSVTQAGANLKEFNLQNVSVGFYFLVVQMDGMETKTIRITVQ